MTKEQINEEIKKIMLKKMFSQTSKEKFEDRWRREGDRIIWEMKAILMSTIIGVFLGVLTNISASFFICQQFDFGFLFLTISLILTFSFFYSWRHYLLQKTSDRLFETLSKMIEAFPSEIELSTKQDEVYDKH
jgi:hypothetical protein